MKLRRVRIMFSALCGFLFVLLIVLWLASYFSHIYFSKRFAASIVSVQVSRGELGVWTTSPLVPGPDVTCGIGGHSLETSVLEHLDAEGEPEFELFGFRYETMPPIASAFFIPFWALVLPIVVAGVLPWVNWRIGWRAASSGLCLTVVVLAVGLWVRSYKRFDITDRASAINICSMNGRLLFGETFMLTGGDSLNPTRPVPPSHLGICSLTPERFQLLPMGVGVAVPYWLVALAGGLMGTASWLRFRFGLQTMLLGMAVFAVLLFGMLSALKR